MNREDIRKLLGGYATGTLTPGEQQALFEAALEDQELFDSLAREQSLRDLLRDPVARAQVLAALDERPAPWYRRLAGWRSAAVLGVVAVASVAVMIVRSSRPLEKLEVAQVRPSVPISAESRPAEPSNPVAAMQPAAPPARPEKRASGALERRRAAPQAIMEPRAELEKSAPPPPPAPFRSADNAVVSEAPLPVSKGDAVPAVKAEVAPPAPPPAAAPSQTKDASGAVGGVMRVVPAQAPRAVTGTTLARLSARDLYYRPAQASQFFGASSGTVRQFTPAPQGQQQQAVKGAEQQKKALDKAAEEALKTAAAPGAANLGVRYIVLRKSANGDFTEADPGELKTGDTVALRFETNDRGFLSVTARRAGATRVVFASPMERMTPRTTSPLRPEDAELLVAFSRQQQGYLVGAFTESPNHQQLAAGERATYVVGDQTAPQVRFTIRLVYK